MKYNQKLKTYGQWLQTDYSGVEIYLHAKTEDESYSFFIYEGKKKIRVVVGNKSEGFFIEQAVAEKKRQAQLRKNGMTSIQSTLSLINAVESYLDYRDKHAINDKQRNEITQHTAYFRRLISLLGENTKIETIGSAEIVEWIETLAMTKPKQTNRFLSASTIRHHVGAARKLFKWLIKGKHYTKLNPCNHEDVIDALPKLDNEKIVYLTEDKKNLILEYVQGLPDPYMRGTFYGYLLSSFRTSDLFSINEDDLDFERCLVRLRDSKRGKRIVAVSEAFMQLCKELIALKRKDCASFEYGLFDDDPEDHKKAVFVTSRGRRRKSFRTQLKTCLRFADIPYDDPATSFTPHSFRHNFATYTLSLSGNMNTTAAALYHTDMKSTQRYAHTIQDNVHKAVNATAAQILGGDTPENLLQVGDI